jgi:hypothetical protein
VRESHSARQSVLERAPRGEDSVQHLLKFPQNDFGLLFLGSFNVLYERKTAVIIQPKASGHKATPQKMRNRRLTMQLAGWRKAEAAGTRIKTSSVSSLMTIAATSDVSPSSPLKQAGFGDHRP